MGDIYINHLAVAVAALSNFAVGALWYSPLLFYKGWKTANGFTDEQVKQGNMAKIYGITLVAAFIMSYNMAFFLGSADTDWVWGTTAGFLTGFGWAFMIFLAIGLFEQRSWKYILINGGYIIVYFTGIGFILGIWR